MSELGRAEADAGEQLALLRGAPRSRAPKPAEGIAEVDPVASVVLSVPLPHLDRPFDYAVPASMAETARPGVRCVVRFAGQRVDGFVIARGAVSEHDGRLARIERVVSAEQVLTPAVLAAARVVADEHAGTLADVLRLAVPPRHARAEGATPSPDAPRPRRPEPGPWSDYRGGAAFLDRVSAGQAPRAAWTALPDAGAGSGWPHAVAVAATTAVAAGRGVLIVVPDHRDVDRVALAVEGVAGPGQVGRLTADQGASARYSAFVAALRGNARIVVGSRAAAFAPVRDLGLLVCWDDGDDLLHEPRAPYPHVRDVLRVRAEIEGAAVLLGGYTRSVDAQNLIETGWARAVDATRGLVRERAPLVQVSGEDDLRDPAARTARIPSLALRVVRAALQRGPVLIQVPRAGYRPGLSCQDCRSPARCRHCQGPLEQSAADAVPRCGWCARSAGRWACATCDSGRLRSARTGVRRTAEEIGRALAGVTVRSSSAESGVLAQVPASPAVVLATPGAEPIAKGGYAAAVLLDAWIALSRADLRAGEEALRRWLTAAALVRPAGDGGHVVLVGDAALAPIQAAVRWDPTGAAARELEERRSLGLPPTGVLAEVVGPAAGVEAFLAALRLPEHATVLGPSRVEVHGGAHDKDGERRRLLVRGPATVEVAEALSGARGVLSAAKAAGIPRVSMRPDGIV